MKSKMSLALTILGLIAVFTNVPAMAGMDSGGAGGSGGMNGDSGSAMGPGASSSTSGPSLSLGREHMVKHTTGSMTDGGVKLDIKPLYLKNGFLKVKFTANTHAGDLAGSNMMEQVSLYYNDVEVKPVEVDSMRGHHSGGTMTFKVDGPVEHFKIVVRGIPNQDERVYEW